MKHCNAILLHSAPLPHPIRQLNPLHNPPTLLPTPNRTLAPHSYIGMAHCQAVQKLPSKNDGDGNLSSLLDACEAKKKTTQNTTQKREHKSPALMVNIPAESANVLYMKTPVQQIRAWLTPSPLQRRLGEFHAKLCVRKHRITTDPLNEELIDPHIPLFHRGK